MSTSIDPAMVKIDATTVKEFVPDKIELRISFEDELGSKDECIAQYNRDLETVITALESAGVNKCDVKQTGFRILPHRETAYKRIEDKSDDNYYRAFEFIDGYEYKGQSSVALDADPNVFGATWLALIKTEGKFTFEFEYGLKDEASAEAELLAETVMQAKVRAEILAKAADAKLGTIHELTHTFYNTGSLIEGLDYFRCEESAYLADPAPAVPDFNPEPINVRCSVACAWKLAHQQPNVAMEGSRGAEKIEAEE